MIVALVATVRAETRPKYGGAIEASLLGAPVSLDPAQAQSYAEVAIAGLVFDALYAAEPDGTARPHLAIGEPILDAAKTTARIAIVPGVKFHDGSALGPADVAASLERARKGPARFALAAIATIKPDADAIELGLRTPVPDLAARLALPQLAITKGGRPPGERPVGSGPFVLDGIDRGKQRIALRAFDDHFAGRPYLDALALRWHAAADGEARRYETNGAQLSTRGATAFAGGAPMYRATELESPTAVLAFLGFGKAHPAITGAIGFRRALDLALGRGALTTISSGERVVPTTVPVPIEAGAAAISNAARVGDVEAAKKLYAGTAVKLEILVEDTRPDDREIAERVLRALDKLGISSTITALPAVTMRDRVSKGACDLYVGQLAAPMTSAVAWWGAAFAAGGDDWFAQRLAGAPLDAAATAKAFAERMPVVPLMFRAVHLWFRTDLRGVGFDALGRVGFAGVSLFGDPVKARK